MSEALSVVIPTYNRCAILGRTLASLRDQRGAPGFEILVVDDGSTDGTEQVVQDLALSGDMALRYLSQPHCGGGAARNRGLGEATGRIVLFMDHDIIASPGLVAGHVAAHAQHPDGNIAILGHVGLAPEVPLTPYNLHHAVSRWEALEDDQLVDWQWFLAGNVSAKRSFLLSEGLFFDESLRRFQDLELGYRSLKKGMTIYYCAQAAGYHYHHLDFEGALRLYRSYGEALAMIHHKHPELRHEVGEYMLFSWRHAPRRVVHDLVRPVFLNRLTVPGLMCLAGWRRASGRDVPYQLARRIGAYREREAYQRQSHQLERE